MISGLWDQALCQALDSAPNLFEILSIVFCPSLPLMHILSFK